MSISSGVTTLILLTLLAFVHFAASRKEFCTGDELTPNDPKVLAGQDLNITCKMNVKCHRDNSSRLYISLGRRILSKEFITVMSENTIQARIPGITIDDDKKFVRCKVNETERSDHFHDLVGTQMLAVVETPYRANMTCIDYQTRRLNCTWSYPSTFVYKHTKVITVNYTVHRRTRYSKCPLYTNWTSGDRFYFSCQFHGYAAHVPYFLRVGIETLLMEHVSEYVYRVDVDKHSIMKANKMEDVTAEPVSGDTVELSWKFKFYYEPLLQFKVQYNASRWKTAQVAMFYQTSIDDQGKKSVNISGLVPNTQYAFSVIAQPNSPAALYWSVPSNVASATTPATVPVKAPTVPPGGYMWVSKSTVRIYWQALNERDHNGRLVGYRIFHEDTTINVDNPGQYYRDVELTGSPSYVIDLRSVNNIGQSQEHSRLIVTARSLRFVNLGVEPTQSKHIIRALWRPPEVEQLIKGYVLYLCEMTISSYCSGPVHYVIVEANKTSEMLDTEQLFGSGASQIKVGIGVVTTTANQSDTYSGITWSSCIYPMSSDARSNVAGAVAPSLDVSDIKYLSATITWKQLTCEESKVWVYNYILRYCEVATCHKSDPVSLSVDVSGVIRHVLTALAPGTSYTVWVEANTTRGVLHTEKDYKKNITTRELKIPDGDLSWDASQVTVTCPPLARQLSSRVVAKFTVSNEEKSLSIVCPAGQDPTVIKFDCDNYQGYSVNLSLHTTVNGQVVRSKPVTKRVCRRVLTTTVIVAVAISCLVGGTCIVSLGYATRRCWIKEGRRVPRRFHYPDEAGERVRETVEESYRSEHDPGFSMNDATYSGQSSTVSCQSDAIYSGQGNTTTSSVPLLCEDTYPLYDVKDKQKALLQQYYPLSTDGANGNYSQFAQLSDSCMEDEDGPSASGEWIDMELLPTPSLQGALHLDTSAPGTSQPPTQEDVTDNALLPTPSLQGALHLDTSSPGTSQPPTQEDVTDNCGFQVVNVHVPSISETLRMRPNIFGDNAVAMLSTGRCSLDSFKEMCAVNDDSLRAGAMGAKDSGPQTKGDYVDGGEGDSKGAMVIKDTRYLPSEDMSSSDDTGSLSPSDPSCSVSCDRVQLDMTHPSCGLQPHGGYVARDGVCERSIMGESDSGCGETTSGGSSGDSVPRDSGYTSPECQGDMCSFDYHLTEGAFEQTSLDVAGDVTVVPHHPCNVKMNQVPDQNICVHT